MFSLKLINDPEPDPLVDVTKDATIALRTLALVRRHAGNVGVGRLYGAIGARVHDRDERLSADLVRDALVDAGLERRLVDDALNDASTADEVRSDHDDVVASVGCFGVPTIVLSSGKGMFGPVISSPPEGEAANELWEHFRWLVEQDGFFELKRDRDRDPGS